jgi:hypothetical protein
MLCPAWRSDDVTEHRRVHFNRMHRDLNLIVGWDFARDGDRDGEFTMGPAFTVANVNVVQRAFIRDFKISRRRVCRE